jgi:hypothetical protein
MGGHFRRATETLFNLVYEARLQRAEGEVS